MAFAWLALLACHHPTPRDRAEALIGERRFSEAEAVLREAVEANPADLDLQLQFGTLLLGQRHCNLALWPLLRASTGEQQATKAAPLVAQCLFQTNNHADAIAVMTRILDEDPDNIAIRDMRARSRVFNHQEVEALADLDWIEDSGHEDVDLVRLELRLRALLQLQRVDEAQATLTRLRDQVDVAVTAERAARLCSVDANFSFERGETERAREKFDDCVAEHPDSEVVVSRAIGFFDAQGDGERGTAILRAALDEKPDSLALTKALADRLRALGRADEALSLLKSARRDENRKDVAVLLAEHHMELDDPASALRDLEWALDAETDEALFVALPEEHRFMLGDILVLLHENERVGRLIEHIEEPAYRQFLVARMKFEAGDHEAALAEFEKGFRIWPSGASPRFLAGQAAEQLGDFAAATDHYRASLRSDASASQAGVALARIYAAQGSWAAAAEALQYHHAAQARDAKALRMLAEVQIQLGNKEFASQLRARLSELPGQRDVALADHARNLASLDSPAAALAFIEKNVPQLLAPEYRECLAVWGESMAGLGRAEEALARVAEAKRSEPRTDARRRIIEAQLLLALGRDSDARALLESAVADAPRETWGLLALARLEAKSERIDRAVALYDRAAGADESEPLALIEAGRLLVERAPGSGEAARAAEAESMLREALRREPTLGEAARLLAKLGLRNGETGEGTFALALRAARFSPGADSAQLLGELYLARNEATEAVDILARAIESDPGTNGRVQYLLGRALLATGEEVSARRAFERALEMDSFEESEQARAELVRLAGAAGSGSS